jgi:hypothetical protein
MGKGSKWRKGHSAKAVSDSLARIKENEENNPTMKFDGHKEVKKKSNGSTSYIFRG